MVRFLSGVMLALALSSSALAQSTFVPFTVTEQDVQQIEQYFRFNTPPAYSEPVTQWLTRLERRAQVDAKAKAATKMEKKDAGPATKTDAGTKKD